VSVHLSLVFSCVADASADYLHIFAKGQPDLNWESAKVRETIHESAIRFWLKKGVDGFRK
jgi:glycosidase